MTEHAPDPASHAPREFDAEIGVKGILWFVVSLLLLSAFAFALMGYFAGRLKSASIARDPAPSPMAEANQPHPRPKVALQADPNADMRKFRAEEEAVLTSYAWVDRSAGVARIPVARAIEIVAEKGLPSPPPPPPAPAAATR